MENQFIDYYVSTQMCFVSSFHEALYPTAIFVVLCIMGNEPLILLHRVVHLDQTKHK